MSESTKELLLFIGAVLVTVSIAVMWLVIGAIV